jgi:hypothetical protein
MNYEIVAKKIKQMIAEIVPNAIIYLANETPKESSPLDIGIDVAEIDANPYTESEMKRLASASMLLSVPVSTGTERINNIASKIQAMFCPIVSKKSGFRVETGEWVRIHSSRQMAGFVNEQFQKYQINVRVELDLYTYEGE